MFTAQRNEVLPKLVVEADKADGFIHFCEQAALMFGSDRRDPRPTRPVVRIRNDGHRVVVLPCTTKDKTGFPDFFDLNDQRVMWIDQSYDRHSFARDRYEVVDVDRVKKKIGMMTQPARIELLRWLKSRY